MPLQGMHMCYMPGINCLVALDTSALGVVVALETTGAHSVDVLARPVLALVVVTGLTWRDALGSVTCAFALARLASSSRKPAHGGTRLVRVGIADLAASAVCGFKLLTPVVALKVGRRNTILTTRALGCITSTLFGAYDGGQRRDDRKKSGDANHFDP
ncbi:hypothetical protein H4R24_000047 [Coemansia sp. RSA 988]|nr:hypothetical protein H4R24_000047 [Coemansia sp. RSA 988]